MLGSPHPANTPPTVPDTASRPGWQPLAPCPHCGQIPAWDTDGVGYTIACANCYDGAPDSATRGEIQHGSTIEQATERWNEWAADVVDERAADRALARVRALTDPRWCMSVLARGAEQRGASWR
jgi:hypothetical protein